MRTLDQALLQFRANPAFPDELRPSRRFLWHLALIMGRSMFIPRASPEFMT